MDDNFEKAMTHLNAAFILSCNGYYEPKSVRDRVLAVHLKHTLDIVLSKEFSQLVADEQRRLDAHAIVKEWMN